MAEQRMTYWAAEDEDLEDVDLNLAIGSFGQTDQYEDGMSKSQNYISDNVTENSRLSQISNRRDYVGRYATADGATSFCPNPRRREEGTCARVPLNRSLTHDHTVHRTLLPSRPREQSCRNHGRI